MPAHSPAPTVRDARAAFFARNGFPSDGGYDDAWAEAEFGVLRYRVPNPPARAEALRLHDLHHLVTGYSTDWRGEALISAWEVASGAGTRPWGWAIMLWGLFTGLVGMPRATFDAFLRGRGARNLYGSELTEELLDGSLSELQEALGVRPGGATRARTRDLLAFAGWSSMALAWGIVATPMSLGLVALAAAQAWATCPCPLVPEARA